MDNKQDIEGREVRKCLINNDIEGFKRQMPECLYPMFDKMRKVLCGDEETEQEPAKIGVYEGLMRDREYRRYRKRLDEAITRLVKKTRKDIIL